MNLQTIESKLRAFDFNIVCTKEIDYGQQIRLDCGVVINIYDKGTVLVQGRIHGQRCDELVGLLKIILPSDTRWCHRHNISTETLNASSVLSRV